jgi:predicted ferric reductase
LFLLLLITGLWLLADTFTPTPFHYFTFRSVFLQYSGIVAIAAMSIAMLLALRPTVLEKPLGGLDKMYRLHKWLGIAALAIGILHWWWAQGTKWMVGWGWLVRPGRGRGAAVQAGGFEGWLHGQRELAESIGEWAFYVSVVLIVLALLKRFPYHLFARTHKWLALAFVALAWHSAILARPAYWTQPIGWLLAALLIGGCFAAVLVLAGRVGAARKVGGRVETLTYYEPLRVLETAIVLSPGWAGHKAGQFAFVTSDRREGAHPYTIASAWNADERRIVFITKALGDHTARLRERLQPGLEVTVEGPYGCFTFDDAQAHQIWIGAGIGITPFIARLKELARTPGHKAVDLFHPTADVDPAALEHLRADARAAGVNLHILVDSQDGLLNGERIRAAAPGWREASFWFCGPPGFGHALRRDFSAQGLPASRFHQELFEMR